LQHALINDQFALKEANDLFASLNRHTRRPLNSRQHPRKNSAKIKIRVTDQKVPDARIRRRLRETPDQSKSARCSSNRFIRTHGVAVAVAVAVGVAVGLGVGVGVGLTVLAVCMATISLSDNAVFQIAACWMLPLAYPVVSLVSKCIKVVRLYVLPVARVAVVEVTLMPSTNNSNAVALRLNAIECQLPSNAVPPEMPLAMTPLLPRARAIACDVNLFWPMYARLLVVVDFEIAMAFPTPKSVPPLKRAKE